MSTGLLRTLLVAVVLVVSALPAAAHQADPRLGFSNPNRDPSFEIFEPPNLFYGPRPVITEVDPTVKRGQTMVLTTPDAGDASSVTLVRNTAMTHLVDSDQRTVELPIVARDADQLTVDVTDNAAVLPDGPYIAFVNKQYDKGETPSVGRQVFVGAVPARFADDIAANNTATVASELAARGLTARAAAAPAPAGVAPAAGPAAAPAAVAAGRAQLPATGASVPIAVLAVSALVSSALLVRRRWMA